VFYVLSLGWYVTLVPLSVLENSIWSTDLETYVVPVDWLRSPSDWDHISAKIQKNLFPKYPKLFKRQNINMRQKHINVDIKKVNSYCWYYFDYFHCLCNYVLGWVHTHTHTHTYIYIYIYVLGVAFKPPTCY
jgi:hypothetical protein